MPEPNLPPLFLSKGPHFKNDVSIDEIEKQLPELPQETRMKLRDNFGLTAMQAVILVVSVHILNPILELLYFFILE